MNSTHLTTLAALALLAACDTAPTSATRLGPDGRPLPVIYRITPADTPRIQARMRDAVNTVRTQRGLAPVELNADLTSASATHARDMSRQARPWLWGSDGSTPLDRLNRVGYRGLFLGEMVSETFETELEVLTEWMQDPGSRGILLDPRVREIGFAWYQEPNGKLWWSLTTGAPQGAAQSIG